MVPDKPTETETLALGLAMGLAMPSRKELLALAQRTNRMVTDLRAALRQSAADRKDAERWRAVSPSLAIEREYGDDEAQVPAHTQIYIRDEIVSVRGIYHTLNDAVDAIPRCRPGAERP